MEVNSINRFLFLVSQLIFVFIIQGCSPMDSIDKKQQSSGGLNSDQLSDDRVPLDLSDYRERDDLAAATVTTTYARSGRYLTKNGKATFFLGVDTQELAANPKYNYISVLDNLVANKINKVRVWVYCSWNRTGFIHPWLLSSGKYNLDKWNEAYWDRLSAIVSAANNRGIVVEVSIFSEYPANRSNRWVTISPWNKANNVNGVFSSNSKGHFFPDFMNLDLMQKSTSGKTLKMYQQALIDKTISELGSYPNVNFEIMNEFPGVLELCGTARCIDQVHPWQTYWVNYINGKSSRIITAHAHEFKLDTHGVEFFWNNANVDILGFHLYSTSPASTSSALNKVQLKNKVIQENESTGFHVTGGVSIVTKQMWALFMAGGHYGIYVDNSTLFTSTNWEFLSRHAKILRIFSERFNLAKMSPVDSGGREYDNQVITTGLTASQWQVLAYPGVQYAAYFYGGTSGSAKANLPSGKQYRYTWYDVRNGNVLRVGLVSGGSGVTLSGPGTSSFDPLLGAALIIEAAATGEIIVDNINPGQTGSGTSATGTWCASAAAGFYGMNSLFSCGKTTTDRYRFTPSIPSTKNYYVYVRYTSNENRSTSARIAVKHATATTVKNYNQQSGGGTWILHGTYKLNSGTGNYIEFYDPAAAAEVSADAVRLLPAP